MIDVSPTLIRGGPLSVDCDRVVQISTVSYEHQMGIPARFCAGLLPVVELTRMLKSHGVKSVIRLVDPTTIAYYCNDWAVKASIVHDINSRFLQNCGIEFFFDEAEPVSVDSLNVLRELGTVLENSSDEEIVDIVRRIKESGRKHGGDMGAYNALLYGAAHPFSWLDMHHPAVWKNRHCNDRQFINLMSRSEERFSAIRTFLRSMRPDLSTKIESVNAYMAVCNTPCYIPLEGEPLYTDLINHGYSWCYNRYSEIKKVSSNHERICRDFRLLMTFLESGSH